jgi:hypothetical protein
VALPVGLIVMGTPAQEKPEGAMNRLQSLEAVLRPCARGSLGRHPDGHADLARKRVAIAIRNNPYRGTGLDRGKTLAAPSLVEG